MINLDYLLEGLNKRDDRSIDKIRAMFGSLTKFIKYYVKKRKKLNELNLDSYWQECNREEEKYFNEICKLVLEEVGPNHKDFNFTDVKFEDGTYYVIPWQLKDLSSLFLRDQSRTVDLVFSDEFFENYTIESRHIDYYYDIVNVLDDKNKKYLKERILEKSHDQTFNEDDFNNPPYDYFDEKGNFIIFNNIDDILKNSELFNEVIELDPFFNIKVDIENLYNYSYNEAWNDIMFTRILDSLSDIFYPDLTWEGDKPKLRIVDFPGFLWTFFNCNNNNNEIILDQYDFISLLYNLMLSGCLEQPEFKTLDFPPSEKVNENINEFFIDYIS